MTRSVLVCLSAALSLSLLHAGPPEANKATIAYVRSLQTPEGGFLPQLPDPKGGAAPAPTLRATLAAARALKYFGGEIADLEVQRFTAACFDKESGGFRDSPRGGTIDCLSSAFGLLVTVELGMPAEPYRAAVMKYLDEHAKSFEDIRMAAAALESISARSPKTEAWLAEVDKLWDASGIAPTKGGHKGRATASVTITALRYGSPLKNREAVLKALRETQEVSGGWAKEVGELADLDSSYHVMRAFMMLKERPEDVPALRNYIAKCRNNDGGYGVAPNEPSSAGGTYYAAIITHWLDRK